MASRSAFDPRAQALSALQAAFKRCKDQGWAFYGMDSQIYSVDAALADSADFDPHEAKYLTPDPLVPINTHGAYRDSGGW